MVELTGDMKKAISIGIIALTVGTGSWLISEPVKEHLKNMGFDAMLSGFALIILGVILIKKYHLNG